MRRFIDRASFFLVGLYLVSQAYTIPLLAVGPWPVWPSLADVVAWAMILLFTLHLRFERQVSHENRRIWNFGIFLLFCCVLAIVGDITFPAKSANSDPKHFLLVALYQLYRLVQFLVVFHVTANLRLDEKRYWFIKKLAITTFFLIVCGVVCTSAAILPTREAAWRLPNSLLAAGPWAFYSMGTVDQGVGFISYNHAYTAIQLILAAGLALHFGPVSNRMQSTIYLLLLGSTFLSGSRAGFLCAFLLVLLYEGSKRFSRSNLAFILLFVLIALGGFFSLFQNRASDDSIVGRQLSAESAYKENGLSGRTSIWSNTVHVLDAEPWRWITGNGFGSALDSGGDAHMLPLMITLETGVAGLILFVVAFARILKFLKSRGESGSAMFWTTVVLLITSLTQETFYPVIAFGHFLGFYFLAVALSLNRFVPGRECGVKVNMARSTPISSPRAVCSVGGKTGAYLCKI